MICSLLLLCAAPALQQPGAADAPLRHDQLELTLYTPSRLDAEELFVVARQMFGRTLEMEDRGIDNLNLLYDSIVIYDLPAEVARIRTALAGLEQSDGHAADGGGAGLPLLRDIPLLDFHLNSMHADAAVQALEPLLRDVPARDDGGEQQWLPNLQVMNESLLLLRDNAENLAAMRSLLERLDQPPPQVAVSAWVLRGGGDVEAPAALPGEMTANLGVLLPGMQFEVLSRGLLQSSAEAGHTMQLRMPGAFGGHYDLQLRTGAFDAANGRLALANCLFRAGTSGESQLLFDTATVLRHGEYAVIGLTGAEPVLLVLRFAALP